MSSTMIDRNQILSGDLTQFPAVDLIQFLGMSQQSGELTIESRNGCLPTRLYLSRGDVIHAMSGTEEGLPAFDRIIRMDKGLFVFRTDRASPRQTILQPLSALLLESIHRRDELAELRKQLPPDDAVLYLNPTADLRVDIRPEEWRVLAEVNGRKPIHRIYMRVGDEVRTKHTILDLLRRGLLLDKLPDSSWHGLVPLPVPQSQVSRERLFPPRIRTNLLLKAIDGKTDLLSLCNRSNMTIHDFFEDIRLLVDASWITFRDEQVGLFKAVGGDF